MLRPQLPPAERLLPYLRRIDAARVYSNWGPLASELELRLAEHLCLPPGTVVSASSGTSALVGAIIATAGRAGEDRPLAVVPAFTFVATALAVEQCGYRAVVADVDADSWLLDPDGLRDRVDLETVGVVVPVAALGRPVPQAPWRSFAKREGIPVVIDGAPSFEAVSDAPASLLGEVPVAISFHATKSFGTGEGGCVSCPDAETARAVTRALNFGIHERREATAPSVNGKMSEYHAAVGLAELDGWAEKRALLAAVIGHYRRAIAAAALDRRLIAAPEVCSSYVLFECASPTEAEQVTASLRRHRVDYRFWYGGGLQRQAYLRDVESEPRLDVTAGLAGRLVGLPMAPDLTRATIDRIVAGLAEGLRGG